MDMRVLGTTGVRVSPLCLGAMMFGAWGNPDHEESARIIGRALDAGINFIDTADVYSGGESEEIVGKALAGGRRDHVVLATKANAPMGADVNERGNPGAGSSASARTACAAWAPTTSTCTRSTGPTRRPTLTRRWAR
jgi:aryl-alcohol dehydrogenase-like predicted oxidoreductase